MSVRNVRRVLACGAVAAVLAMAAPGRMVVRAQNGATQTAAALTGVVSSQEEGKMEGVLVTARRDGANFDVTVVSDAQGKFSFPRTHVQSGRYAVKIRAIGYDLVDPGSVEV